MITAFECLVCGCGIALRLDSQGVVDAEMILPPTGEPNPNESVARSQAQATVLVHALQQEKLMTECQVLSVQSGPSLKTATKGEEQGSEEYEHSIAAYHSSPQVQRLQ